MIAGHHRIRAWEELGHQEVECVVLPPEAIGSREEEFSLVNDLNRRLGAAVLEDGRVYFGSTVYEGRVAFRPAIVNWRTRDEDVDLIVDVTRELSARLAASESSRFRDRQSPIT